MAFSTSSIFRQLVADMFEGTVGTGAGADSMDWKSTGGATTVKAALYDNDVVPDNDATAANTAYNAGAWVITGNEVSDGTNWNAGGEPLTSRVINLTADTVSFDAADTPQAGATTTLANVFGCLVYCDSITTPVADQGFCFNDFGGSQSVTAGNFTVIWDSGGVFAFTMTAA